MIAEIPLQESKYMREKKKKKLISAESAVLNFIILNVAFWSRGL